MDRDHKPVRLIREQLRPPRLLVFLVGAASLLGGCSVAGSWRVVDIDPAGAPFPVDQVTFSAGNQYTASWTQAGEKRTGTGDYRLRGSMLDIMEQGRAPRSYHLKRRGNDTILLTYRENNAAVTATLKRAE